jgi:predicted peptidase
MKNQKMKCLLLFASLFIFFSMDQVIAQSERFSFNKFISDKGDTLNYRFLFPDNSPLRKYPLVIFLHGSGERGNDNESQLKWGALNFATDHVMSAHPSFVIAPQCPKNMVWANFKDKKHDMRLLPTPSKPMELVMLLIQDLLKKYPIDTNRIYITGLSLGGFGTFDAIQRHPHVFAAAVPVCGGGDTSRAASISHIPIWLFHGSEDPTVDPKFSTDMVSALTKAGGNPGLTLYPGVGHFSWVEAYSDPLMMEWLFKQHK